MSFLALLSGAVLPLAFAPFSYFFVAILAAMGLLIAWLKATPKQALWRGYLFGLGYFGFGVNWVYISIHQYGNATPAIAVIVTILLVMYLALFPALQGYFFTRIYPTNHCRKLLLAFPASWVIFEWIRSWVFTGFPWLILGYSQISSPLRGLAALIGVYGISFVVALSAGAIVALFYCKKNLSRILIILTVAIIWVGSFYLTKISWTKPEGEKFKVSLIQGNIAQEQKWNGARLDYILTTYAKLTSKNWDNKIIVWPEAAIPAFKEEVAKFVTLQTKAAKAHQTTIVSGIPIKNQNTQHIYNGIITFGANQGEYLKKHLVPFGEFLPFKEELNWLHKYFLIPMSDFSNGPRKQPALIVDGILVAPFICYEIAYPHLVLSYFPRAELIITLCDDSWFGKSPAAAQHLEIAQMRSLETGRYQLLATNTGLTAIINDKGEIIAQAPVFKQYVLTAKVQAMNGATPLVEFGHYLWFLLMLIALWLATIQPSEKNTK